MQLYLNMCHECVLKGMTVGLTRRKFIRWFVDSARVAEASQGNLASGRWSGPSAVGKKCLQNQKTCPKKFSIPMQDGNFIKIFGQELMQKKRNLPTCFESKKNLLGKILEKTSISCPK